MVADSDVHMYYLVDVTWLETVTKDLKILNISSVTGMVDPDFLSVVLSANAL